MRLNQVTIRRNRLLSFHRNLCAVPEQETNKDPVILQRPSAIDIYNVPQNEKTAVTKFRKHLIIHEQLRSIKEFIPKQYHRIKRNSDAENLYLICPNIAKKAASYILPAIEENKNQIVCETNTGLGLISSELLKNGVKFLRMYESDVDFRLMLKEFSNKYPGRVEIFTKDIFLLYRYAWMDRQDKSNRVEIMLNNVPKKNWHDDPCMTIIGSLTNNTFIKYLMRSLILQADIMAFGRIQLFAFMKPRDFVVLTATTKNDYQTYKRWSVLFNLFFEYELLEKFPKDMFIPWESKKLKQTQYMHRVDPDMMYFVKINFKKDMPVPTEDLLQLYYFITTIFIGGHKKLIPEMEKHVPGCGLNILVPQFKHSDYFEEMNDLTEVGELNVNQFLAVFKEVKNHRNFEESSFESIVESNLLKSHTIETALNESPEDVKTAMEEIKMDIPTFK